MMSKVEDDSEMVFLLQVWCPDCTGEDFQGCFDGGSEEEWFKTAEAAIQTADETCHDVIWNARVLRRLKNDKWELIYETSYDKLYDGKEIINPPNTKQA